MRGLKPVSGRLVENYIKVASFTDAWIETSHPFWKSDSAIVASFTDAWIETGAVSKYTADQTRRIFYRCVDWNIKKTTRFYPITGRIFYRCVDWNRLPSTIDARTLSRIFYRCVDWNWCCVYIYGNAPEVASFTDAWIETYHHHKAYQHNKSHLLQMRGLKLDS